MTISRDAQALYRITLTWSVLGRLFGVEQPGQVFDPTALWKTLEEARRNLEEVQQRQGVVDSLQSSTLAGAESLVEKYFGLRADGAPLRVVLEDDMGGAMASLSYAYD
ncbi:MAG: hypothetical protein ACM3XM_16110, partial [Mycobacterium leprae]